MPPKQERDAEEDDATWMYRNLERKLVLKETIYGPSHIAVVPTLLALAVANFENYERNPENIHDAVALVERALSIRGAHPNDASSPSALDIVELLRYHLHLCNDPYYQLV